MKVWTWARRGLNSSWTYELACRSAGRSMAAGVVRRKFGAARAANPKPMTAAQNRARASTIRRVGMAERGRL
jgi:hypothetical protein